jgi:hypothetical protein
MRRLSFDEASRSALLASPLGSEQQRVCFIQPLYRRDRKLEPLGSGAVWHLAAAAVAYPTVSSVLPDEAPHGRAKSVVWLLLASAGLKLFTASVMNGLPHAFWRGLTPW